MQNSILWSIFAEYHDEYYLKHASRSALLDIKHEATAECLITDNLSTAGGGVLNGLINDPSYELLAK
jgi:predicted exporter